MTSSSEVTKKNQGTGYVGDLSEKQEEVLKELKERLLADGEYSQEPKPTYSDEHLLRFCRARKFEIENVYEMFINDIKWRKEIDIEKKYNEYDWDLHNKALEFYPSFFHGSDREGRPVYIQYLGDINVDELFKVSTPQRELDALIIQGEKNSKVRYPACSKVVGKSVETTTSIMDLDGVSLRQFWKIRKVLTDMMPVTNDHYPETMGKVYLINAPSIFTMMWGAVKGYMDPVSQEKVHILGSNYREELLKMVDVTDLPERLGGECTCTEGCIYSDKGPWKSNQGEKQEENEENEKQENKQE